jgi:hypothetical protein
MKSTDNFKKVIEKYLTDRAKTDNLFAVSFEKEKKNIDDCITYILTSVQTSGCSAFTNEEVYSMAVHYYDEDDITIGSPINNCTVVTDQKVDLTPEEIEEAKKLAKQKIIDDECTRLKVKPVKAPVPKINKKETHQLSLKI